MKKLSGVAAFCALVITSAVFAAEKSAEVDSGLEVGAQVPAFNVRDITGPHKGETLCYRCAYGASPVVAVFTKKVDENVTSLIQKIDATVGKNKDAGMKAFIVVLTDDPDKVEPSLEKIAKEQKIEHTPLTIIEGAGPEKYKLSKDAETTVLMWNESKVAVRHGYAAGKLDKKAVDMLVGETKKILE